MHRFTRDDRQSILDRVYTHFIENQQPAGRDNGGARCLYHGVDKNGQQVSCAIGIFDTDHRLDRESLITLGVRQMIDVDPDALADVFGSAVFSDLDLEFLIGVQDEHDLAVRHAVLSDQDFDTFFIEELAHRLDRFAGEQDLVSPCSPSDFGPAEL